MVERARTTFDDRSSLAFASAAELSGLIDLDTNRPLLALAALHVAFEIRQARRGANKDDPLVALSLNNIGLSLTETGSSSGGDRAGHVAVEFLQRAMDMRQRMHSSRIGNSYSNMASALLRMGRLDEAEAMLRRCPALRDLVDDESDVTGNDKTKDDDDDDNDDFLSSGGNPRFSSDMVLLSRIRLRQGRLDAALRLASKALAFRRRVLGDKLKSCDLMYYVADMLLRQGKTAAAM
jgi:tetratricopeptide (TPR) repeat protein